MDRTAQLMVCAVVAAFHPLIYITARGWRVLMSWYDTALKALNEAKLHVALTAGAASFVCIALDHSKIVDFSSLVIVVPLLWLVGVFGTVLFVCRGGAILLDWVKLKGAARREAANEARAKALRDAELVRAREARAEQEREERAAQKDLALSMAAALRAKLEKRIVHLDRLCISYLAAIRRCGHVSGYRHPREVRTYCRDYAKAAFNPICGHFGAP